MLSSQLETVTFPAARNRFLASLPQETQERLAPCLSRVNLPHGARMVEPNQSNRWVYFPERGMASVTSADRSGTSIEVGIIGREGIVGVHTLLGQRRTQNSIIMQVPGEAYRVPVEVLAPMLQELPAFSRALHTFVYVLLEQTTQLVLCNRLHELEARLARWLLMTCDMVESRTLNLTQEFLAEMLGVGRPTVTISAGILQRAGAISYSRGLVEVINPELLKQSACECYGIIRDTYKRAYALPN